MKSVLVIANQFFKGIFAGGDRVFVELCRNWGNSGIHLHVVAPETGAKLCRKYGLEASYRELRETSLDRSESPLAIPIIMLLRTIQTILTLKQLPQSDAIYTPGDFLSNTMPAVIHRIIHPSVPWITHVYIVIPTPARRQLSFLSDLISWSLQRASLQLMKSFSTIVVVLDSMTGKQLVQAGVPRRKIYVSSGGIPLAQVDNTQPEGVARFDGCFVGRIHPSKGVFDLVDIWSKVCKEIPNAKLVVIGDGAEPYVAKLKKTIQDLSMEEQISLKGFRQNPFGWMKASRVFIYPDHEIIYGWGLAVAEALACSIPAVVYDQPGHREAFKDGLVTVPRWDSDRYAKEVVRLLKDDSYRTALGFNGRRAIEDYDWARVSDRLLKVIRDLN